jgi:hypothetical protein
MPPMDVYVTGMAWRKSRRSVANGACVEVAPTATAVARAILVRDSVDPSGPAIEYAVRTWQSFVTETKAGTYDPSR